MSDYSAEMAKLGPDASARITRVDQALRQSVPVNEYEKIRGQVQDAYRFAKIEHQLASEGKLGPEASEQVTLASMYPSMKGK